MNLQKRLLRDVVIGFVVGGAVFWWRRHHAETNRIHEVRQRMLPGLTNRLAQAGFAPGDPIFIRIFKETRELELWLKPQGSARFRLWKNFHVAAMSGTIGPKLVEGDGQAPEGFYEVNAEALNPMSGRHLSFSLGFPNACDQANGRTGSWIMVHGGTDSAGCFAMSDPLIEEIYLLAEAALRHGQKSFQVHVFPFRMTEERMVKAKDSEWLSFWENLKGGYDKFERTHLPPQVTAQDGRYVFNTQR